MSTVDLTGRVALISGASRGIGHAIAAALLACGAAVTITTRKPDELAAAAEELASTIEAGADINVVAALGFVQQAHRAWMGEHGGAVVNVASIAGLRSTGAIAAYGMSKAAMIRLTEELAWELGPSIRVNAVAPAVVKTRFSTTLYARDEEQVAKAYPMGRLGTPADVAALVSDAACWITGETVRIDGGLLATGPR